MRCRSLNFWFWIPALLACAAFAAAEDAASPELIVTRDSKFAIPFQVDAEPGERTDVRLYVSDDLGRNWKLYSRAQAPIDSFDFQAAGEREYWFTVRTLDAEGRETPQEPFAAELRVIVDSTPPKLELSTESKADGEIAVRWKVEDEHLSVDSLKLSYRSRAGGDQPREVQAQRTKRQLDQRSAAGETAWRPEGDASELILRAEIRDAADNLVVREVAIAHRPATTAPNQPQPAPSALSREPESQTVAPPMAIRDPTKPMLVNSTSFELDYDIQRSPAAVTKVEVWGTRDNGRNWVQLGLDDDRRSPCAVNVETEGLYGFAIVIEEEGGLKGRTPQPGDSPEIRVGVDLSVPRVRLTTAEPDAQGRPCFMKINWEALDDHLGPQAVTLSYSATARGPWTPLVQGIASSGGHVCEFDPNGPDYAFLKIDVRDDAGNIGTFTTTTALPIEKRQVQFSFAGAGKNGGSQSKPKWFHVLH